MIPTHIATANGIFLGIGTLDNLTHTPELFDCPEGTELLITPISEMEVETIEKWKADGLELPLIVKNGKYEYDESKVHTTYKFIIGGYILFQSTANSLSDALQCLNSLTTPRRVELYFDEMYNERFSAAFGMISRIKEYSIHSIEIK